MAKKETGIQFLARLGTRPTLAGVERVLFDQGPHSKDVIEVYGGEGTGKKELLLHLLVRCIVPEEWNGLRLGGQNAGVVYIDLDHKFSILRLAGLVERYILYTASQRNTTDTNTDIDSNLLETFVRECLNKVHIVRCSDSSQLVISLRNLETLVCNQPDISSVMVDSISAFYWIDRSNGGDSVQAQEHNMKLVTTLLGELVNTYNLTLFVTKAAVFKKKGQESYSDSSKVNHAESNETYLKVNDDLELEHAEFMCKPWQRFVTHRLVVVLVPGSGNKQQVFMVGGDCVQGNTQFVITDAGIQFLVV